MGAVELPWRYYLLAIRSTIVPQTAMSGVLYIMMRKAKILFPNNISSVQHLLI